MHVTVVPHETQLPSKYLDSLIDGGRTVRTTSNRRANLEQVVYLQPRCASQYYHVSLCPNFAVEADGMSSHLPPRGEMMSSVLAAANGRLVAARQTLLDFAVTG